MGTFIVRVYSPYTLAEFNHKVEASSSEEARKNAVGKTARDPTRPDLQFEIEDHNIMAVYPFKTVESLPYKVAQPDPAIPPPPWLLGATIIEDKPLPKGSRPKGPHKLQDIRRNGVSALVYRQDIKSREYPELTFHIQFKRDILTVFMDHARRLNREGKIAEATLYLVEHSPGITKQMIVEILGRGYWTIHRAMLPYIKPTMRHKERVLQEIQEKAESEGWTAEKIEQEKQKALEELERTRTPLIITGEDWRGKLTYYPIRHKTEEELFNEATRLYERELVKPDPQKIRKDWRKHRDAILKQKLRALFERRAK